MLLRVRGYSRFVFDFEGRLGLVFPAPAIRTTSDGVQTTQSLSSAAVLFCSVTTLALSLLLGHRASVLHAV